MKVFVDQDLCIGDESCVEVCPDVFEMEEDLAVAKLEEVPEEFQEACREAAETCPVDAIIVEE